MRFRFVHASDLHLDSPVEGIARTLNAPASIREALRDATLDAFDALVQLCTEREAVFLLLAGDVYDGIDRGLRGQLRFFQGLSKLSDAGIQVFVVHGNHDPVEPGGWTAIREFPR